MGSPSMLNSFRAKTKVFDMILGTLLLVTGGYLMFRQAGGIDTWLWVKLGLFFAIIPLGIIGMRKSNKVMVLASLALAIYLYPMSKNRSVTMQPHTYDAVAATDALAVGQVIYEGECIRCHGPEGNAGYYKAYNLQESKLDKDGVLNVLRNGRNTMPAYPSLSEEQLNAVADYALSLKK